MLCERWRQVEFNSFRVPWSAALHRVRCCQTLRYLMLVACLVTIRMSAYSEISGQVLESMKSTLDRFTTFKERWVRFKFRVWYRVGILCQGLSAFGTVWACCSCCLYQVCRTAERVEGPFQPCSHMTIPDIAPMFRQWQL